MPSLSQRAQRAGHTLVTEALPHGMHGRHPQTEHVQAPSRTVQAPSLLVLMRFMMFNQVADLAGTPILNTMIVTITD